jgi:hypothetical protein
VGATSRNGIRPVNAISGHTTEVKNGTTTSKNYTANQLTEISVGGVTGKYWYDDVGNNDCLTLAAGTQADCSRRTV